MWRDSQTTDNLSQLLDEVKSYVRLEKEYLTLDLVEKLSKLFSAIVLGFIITCLGIVVLFYLSFTVIYLISPLLGSITAALTLVTLLLVLLLYCFYRNREKWILLPITQFVAGILLGNEDEQTEDNHKEEGEI